MIQKQRILIFQQNGSGEKKIQGVRDYGDDHFFLEIISIDTILPPVIDDTKAYLPDNITSDIALDYFKHPDLSLDAAHLCQRNKIPIVASGKKINGAHIFSPPTCCGLSRQACLGLYGERFGAPEFDVTVTGAIISAIEVLRGAPCGATWKAAERIIGMECHAAATRIGLEAQFFCSADPAGWDPIYGKSPVHFAGNIHHHALIKALKRCENGLII